MAAFSGEILFLAHRVPFPPDRGDKIRSHHLLKHLAGLAPVHVATFGETEDDMAQTGELAALAQSWCLVRRRLPVPLAALAALATGRPVSLAAFSSPRLRRYVAEVLAARPISAIVVFSGQMAQFLPARFAGRTVMDFVDVDSAKFEAYADRAPPGLRQMYAREARLLRAHETAVAARFDCSLLCTAPEAALFASRAGNGAVLAVENGIDTVFYDPAGCRPAPALLNAGPNLIFTGQMDYPPNVEAVAMFAREVMPLIRRDFPQARFAIVGRAPVPQVRALEGVHGTMVTGEVPDVRGWLAGADLVVAPLLIARGVQNKVLEAMAMARPVLATTAAATGIPAVDGETIAIADGADTLAARACALLADPHGALGMGAAARRFVLHRRGWAATLAPLEALLAGEEPPEPVAQRDAA